MELFARANDYNKCVLKDSVACEAMNNPPCANCEIGKMSEDRQKEIMGDYELVLTLLPEGGVAPFYESETCLLCRDEPKNKRECYAIADFAHAEPQRTKPSAIGIRVKTSIGSLIPVQIAACSRCRRNLVTADYLQWVVMIIAGLIGLGALSVTTLRESLIGVNELLPLGIFIALIFVALFVGKWAQKLFIKRKSRETIMNVNELERIQALRDKGWFSVSDDKKTIRMLFSKKPLQHGWFTPGKETKGQ